MRQVRSDPRRTARRSAHGRFGSMASVVVSLVMAVAAVVAVAVARFGLGHQPSRRQTWIWRIAVIVVSLVSVLLYPKLVIVAVAVWLWVGWLVYRDRATSGVVSETQGQLDPGRPVVIRLRYLGGHPGLPVPGRGALYVWPADEGVLLRVGRRAIAFPRSAVRSVTLVEGRVGLRTGVRGLGAQLVGRALAFGRGRFCEVRPYGRDDVAVIDRSRVVCDLDRQGRTRRLVLAGPQGGGEEIYLETLVALRPAAVRPEAGATGHDARRMRPES